MWEAIKNFFKLFGKMFRKGLDKFLKDRFDEALALALDLLRDGSFESTHEYAQALWEELRRVYKKEPGTWLTILQGYLCDALKNQGMLNFEAGTKSLLGPPTTVLSFKH